MPSPAGHGCSGEHDRRNKESNRWRRHRLTVRRTSQPVRRAGDGSSSAMRSRSPAWRLFLRPASRPRSTLWGHRPRDDAGGRSGNQLGKDSLQVVDERRCTVAPANVIGPGESNDEGGVVRDHSGDSGKNLTDDSPGTPRFTIGVQRLSTSMFAESNHVWELVMLSPRRVAFPSSLRGAARERWPRHARWGSLY
jgi:hypothetical protein